MEEEFITARKSQLEQKVERSRNTLAQYFENNKLVSAEPLSKLPEPSVEAKRAENPTKTPIGSDFQNVKKPHAWFVDLGEEEVKEKEIPAIPKYTPKKSPFKPTPKKNMEKQPSTTKPKVRATPKATQFSPKNSVANSISVSSKKSVNRNNKSSELMSLKELYQNAPSPSSYASKNALTNTDTSMGSEFSSEFKEFIKSYGKGSEISSNFSEFSNNYGQASKLSSDFNEFVKSIGKSSQSSSKIEYNTKGFETTTPTKSEITSNSSEFYKSMASPPKSKSIPTDGVYYIAHEFMASPIIECLDSILEQPLDSVSKSMLSFDI